MSPSYDYDDRDDDYDDADDHHHDVFDAGEKDGDKHGTTTAAEKHEQQLWQGLWSTIRLVPALTYMTPSSKPVTSRSIPPRHVLAGSLLGGLPLHEHDGPSPPSA